MLSSWCLGLKENKDRNKQNSGGGKKMIITSLLKFLFRWLPMAFIFPLFARIVHAYFHKYLMTLHLKRSSDGGVQESINEKVQYIWTYITFTTYDLND
jgi:hypothetical protein